MTVLQSVLCVAVGAALTVLVTAVVQRRPLRRSASKPDVDDTYRRLVEVLPLTVYIDEPDADATCRFISPQIEALTGWTQEEWLLPGFFHSILHPEDRAMLDGIVARTSEGEGAGCEYRLLAKDGRILWVQDVAVAELDATGRTIAVYGFLLDIGERKLIEEEREQARAEYQTLLEELPAVVYLDAADDTGSSIYMSPRIEELLGYPLEAWLNEPEFFVDRVLHPDDRERVLVDIAANNLGHRNLSEYRCVAADGRVVWFYDQSVPQFDADGRIVGTRGCMIEITDLKVAQDERERLQRRLQTLVEHLPGAVFRCSADASLHVEYLSEGIESITGYRPAQLMRDAARPFSSIVFAEDLVELQRRIADALRNDRTFQMEFRVLAADGKMRWAYMYGRATRPDDAGTRSLDGVILDATERREAEQARERAEDELRRQSEMNRHQALHDALTGLPNRALFRDRIEHALQLSQRESRSFAVLLVDLDRFKEVNDSLGHQSGDELLSGLAGRLRTVIRASDTVARLGGDEFGIVLPSGSRGDALAVAAKVRAQIARPLTVSGLELEVDASIGISVYPQDGEDVETLLRRADVAMYHSKRINQPAVYDPEHDHNSPDRLQLVSGLRRALAEREIEVYFQPQATAADGTIVSFEALARWNHPDLGLLSPASFIPLAEHTGLIRPLTHYVTHEALAQCRLWHDQGFAVGVAVNICSRDLLDSSLPDEVAAALMEAGLPPEILELEITEDTILTDPVRAKVVLARLSDMGVRLAIDDFGSGHSSLGYLKRLPVTTLKIDRSFVANMDDDENDAVIVRSTIELGHNLGLKVIAEGVENADVMCKLAALACDEIQGYHLSRPLPAETATTLLRLNRSEGGRGRRPAAA